MTWTAIIPLKGSNERKTRLAPHLDPDGRWKLSEAMFAHVASVLRVSPDIRDVALLSDVRPAGWNGTFYQDRGRGLNAEARAVAESLASKPILVIHADLPLLSTTDIAVLLTEAAGGLAIAPDHRGTGTNAIALARSGPFPFAFGPDSFTRHAEATRGRACVVRRLGLAMDVDTVEDYEAALALGCIAQ